MEQDFSLPSLRDFGKGLADLLLPRYCLVCGRRLATFEHHLCLCCWGDLPYTRNWDCPHNTMADRYNTLLVRNEMLQERAGASPVHSQYQFAAALFFYQEHNLYRRITQALKYKGDLAAGRYFGRMLGQRLKESWGADADLVVPVPLHWTRRLSRGYNQSAVIAGAIAEVLGISMAPDLLYRARRTRTQTQVNTEEKMKNVEGAFKVNGRLAGKYRKTEHIILVDDVFTTGATMCSAYIALRACFPEPVRISAVTLGCVHQ